MSGHQQSWDDALATEQTHQRELLATLRGELGAFARECADALTTLDALVGGLSGAASLTAAAQKGYAEAKLVHDLTLTLPSETAEGRSDSELLDRVCGDASVRVELERVLGPAPVAALQALQPLSRWIPAIASIRRGESSARELAEQATKDVIRVLDTTAKASGSEAETVVADVGSLGVALRDAAAHVDAAALAVRDGKLEQALAEARATLEGDLETLRDLIDRAGDGGGDWLRERRQEHERLSDEVREKLERVDRIRRVLGSILPHLQAVARSLASAQRFVEVERRVLPEHAVAAEASRLALLLDLASLWQSVLPGDSPTLPRHRVVRRRRWLAPAAVVVLLGGGVGIALAVGGGSKKRTTAQAPISTVGPPTTAASAPASASPRAPAVSPVRATFDPAQKATFYTVSASGQGSPTYAWKLTPPQADPTCNHFSMVAGQPNRAVWRHADTDGCNHSAMGPAGHLGTVTVTVKTAAWECTATFFGTNTSRGPPARRCRRI